MDGISCIICAYNEGERIRCILEAVKDHPALKEIIVVNDGSTDDTEALIGDAPGIRPISYATNRGKTYAMSRGIEAATGKTLMFLDADLAGVGPREIDQLAAPVVSGRAQASISLRSNSLALYRAIGLDFVSGERVIPAWLVKNHVETMANLPRWGAEAFINRLIVRAGLRLEVVDWRNVANIRKYEKVGLLRGIAAEVRMIDDALRVLPPLELVRQNVELLRLVNRPKRRRPMRERLQSLATRRLD